MLTSPGPTGVWAWVALEVEPRPAAPPGTGRTRSAAPTRRMADAAWLAGQWDPARYLPRTAVPARPRIAFGALRGARSGVRAGRRDAPRPRRCGCGNGSASCHRTCGAAPVTSAADVHRAAVAVRACTRPGSSRSVSRSDTAHADPPGRRRRLLPRGRAVRGGRRVVGTTLADDRDASRSRSWSDDRPRTASRAVGIPRPAGRSRRPVRAGWQRPGTRRAGLLAGGASIAGSRSVSPSTRPICTRTPSSATGRPCSGPGSRSRPRLDCPRRWSSTSRRRSVPPDPTVVRPRTSWSARRRARPRSPGAT